MCQLSTYDLEHVYESSHYRPDFAIPTGVTLGTASENPAKIKRKIMTNRERCSFALVTIIDGLRGHGSLIHESEVENENKS